MVDYFGWTIWTGLFAGDLGWVSSHGINNPEDFEPSEEGWDLLYSKLDYVLEESWRGAHTILDDNYVDANNLGTENYEYLLEELAMHIEENARYNYPWQSEVLIWDLDSFAKK